MRDGQGFAAFPNPFSRLINPIKPAAPLATLITLSTLKNMHLHWIDITIIAGYVLATLVIGFWISKRASTDLRSYFLGGNTLPWYMLGLSNASGMFDISGTMWMVYLLFVYGLKSVWIPWLWPVFNQVFMMVFLSIWLRRSGVMTGAEWITFRFGRSRGATLSNLIVVVFALLNVIGFIAFGFIGIGKFAAAGQHNKAGQVFIFCSQSVSNPTA